MVFTIFYSWQSDISSQINRNFIEDALEIAIKKIGKDITIQEALRNEEIKLDKDTKGVSGIPPIVEVIFQKISKCGIFVPDLTFVGKTKEGRFLQNPNVLVEYGWALKEVTHARIVPVMNTAFGKPSGETLPFDMRHLRHPLTYHLPENASTKERSNIKTELSKELADEIELIIKNNLIDKTTSTLERYQETPTTTKPSTFLELNELFLVEERFNAKGSKRYLPDCQHYFLRLIPSTPISSGMTSKQALDLIKGGGLRPMCERNIGWLYGRNKHGSFVCSSGDDRVLNLTQLFKTGELWGIDADAIEKNRLMKRMNVDFGFFPSSSLEIIFNYTLANYTKFASETLKLQLPLEFIAGATEVERYKMAAPSGHHFSGLEQYGGNVVDENIIYKGTITDYKIKASDILLPFFNRVWEECGLDRPEKVELS